MVKSQTNVTIAENLNSNYGQGAVSTYSIVLQRNHAYTVSVIVHWGAPPPHGVEWTFQAGTISLIDIPAGTDTIHKDFTLGF